MNNVMLLESIIGGLDPSVEPLDEYARIHL
jgi:hypothetical protein